VLVDATNEAVGSLEVLVDSQGTDGRATAIEEIHVLGGALSHDAPHVDYGWSEPALAGLGPV